MAELNNEFLRYPDTNFRNALRPKISA